MLYQRNYIPPKGPRRTSEGNIPPWAFNSTNENSDWILFEVGSRHAEWRRFKLCANGKVLGPANYWLAWNGMRLAQSSDERRLTERPRIYEAVIEVLAAIPAVHTAARQCKRLREYGLPIVP